jgi:hypothetical protein
MVATVEGLQREISAQEAYIAQLKADNPNGINNNIIRLQEQALANARTQLQQLRNSQPIFTNPNNNNQQSTYTPQSFIPVNNTSQPTNTFTNPNAITPSQSNYVKFDKNNSPLSSQSNWITYNQQLTQATKPMSMIEETTKRFNIKGLQTTIENQEAELNKYGVYTTWTDTNRKTYDDLYNSYTNNVNQLNQNVAVYNQRVKESNTNTQAQNTLIGIQKYNYNSEIMKQKFLQEAGSRLEASKITQGVLESNDSYLTRVDSARQLGKLKNTNTVDYYGQTSKQEYIDYLKFKTNDVKTKEGRNWFETAFIGAEQEGINAMNDKSWGDNFVIINGNKFLNPMKAIHVGGSFTSELISGIGGQANKELSKIYNSNLQTDYKQVEYGNLKEINLNKAEQTGRLITGFGSYAVPYFGTAKMYSDIVSSENPAEAGIYLGTGFVLGAGFKGAEILGANALSRVNNQFINKIAKHGTQIGSGIFNTVLSGGILYSGSQIIGTSEQNPELAKSMEKNFRQEMAGIMTGSKAGSSITQKIMNPIALDTLWRVKEKEIISKGGTQADVDEFREIRKYVYGDMKGKKIEVKNIDEIKVERLENNPKAKKVITDFLINNKNKLNIFGSSVQRLQSNAEGQRISGDIDIGTKNKKVSQDIITNLVNSLNKNGVMAKVGVSNDKWKHPVAVIQNPDGKWDALISAGDLYQPESIFNRIMKYSDVFEFPQFDWSKTPEGVKVLNLRTQLKLKIDGAYINNRAKDLEDLRILTKSGGGILTSLKNNALSSKEINSLLFSSQSIADNMNYYPGLKNNNAYAPYVSNNNQEIKSLYTKLNNKNYNSLFPNKKQDNYVSDVARKDLYKPLNYSDYTPSKYIAYNPFKAPDYSPSIYSDNKPYTPEYKPDYKPSKPVNPYGPIKYPDYKPYNPYKGYERLDYLKYNPFIDKIGKNKPGISLDKNNDKFSSFFDVFVKGKNGFFKITGLPELKSKAIVTGAKFIDNNQFASFKLIESSGQGSKEKVSTEELDKFMGKLRGKISKGIELKTPDYFVEKNKFRIDSPGEKNIIKPVKNLKIKF